MMEKFKTVHENEVFLNPPKKITIEIPEKLNMEGIQEFVNKYKSAEKDLKQKIKGLQRWNDTYDGMCLDIDGEFILLEDVLKLLGE